jgi:hypothetical protein
MSIASALLLFAQAASATPAATPPAQSAPATVRPVTVEYYYRIKWGSLSEFPRLYRKNHQPVLEAMKDQGFITAIRMDEPFTHLAGDERWDLRVTITFRDAESAVGGGGAYDQAAGAVMERLYPDRAAFEREEAQRFALVEEHWDVIVVPVDDE